MKEPMIGPGGLTFEKTVLEDLLEGKGSCEDYDFLRPDNTLPLEGQNIYVNSKGKTIKTWEPADSSIKK